MFYRWPALFLLTLAACAYDGAGPSSPIPPNTPITPMPSNIPTPALPPVQQPLALALTVAPLPLLPGAMATLRVQILGGGTLSEPCVYAWDFGDGAGTSGSANWVNHAYAASGLYPASVTVTEATGRLTTTTAMIGVQ